MKYLVPLWAASTAYGVDDGVEYLQQYYRCTTAHTSTSTFDPTKFTLIQPGDTYYSEMRDVIYSDRLMAVDIVEIHTSPALYLCTGGFSISVDTPTAPNSGANTYTAQGEFLGFSSMSEDLEVKVGKFSLSLSGLTTLTQTFTKPDVSGSRVVIYKCFMDITTGTIVDRPFLLFDGQINGITITESSRTCTINIDCASIFADFERSNGRKTNNESNWLFQGTKYDKTFELTGVIKNTEIKWGRTT
jgi:hypothetical protein